MHDTPELVYVAAIESAFVETAQSHAGAYGLFQIMDITEKHMNSLHHMKLDRKKLVDNMVIAKLYWAWLTKRQPVGADYRWRLVAYNWGYGRAMRWHNNPMGLPAETSRYIDRYNKLQKQCGE